MERNTASETVKDAKAADKTRILIVRLGLQNSRVEKALEWLKGYKSALFELTIQDEIVKLPNRVEKNNARTYTPGLIANTMVTEMDNNRDYNGNLIFDMYIGIMNYVIDELPYGYCLNELIDIDDLIERNIHIEILTAGGLVSIPPKDTSQLDKASAERRYISTDKQSLFYLCTHKMNDLLDSAGVKLTTYILTTIYRDFVRHRYNKRIVIDASEGGIFDSCSDENIADIVLSNAKPKVGEDAEKEIRKIAKDMGESAECTDMIISTINNELSKLNGSLYYFLSEFLKEHPIAGIICGFILGIFASLIANWLS